ncbi:Zn-dependent exopeptidase [Violaceomyces palustris]|uniref:Zn-dependent exopeptidase n=1 Tax=Violaceomyces palustris TaxID=1673888 RepID=A0ACD0P830_9BASI|nr:Zn-dependent exopeptidase [Violaceomyces palustris]
MDPSSELIELTQSLVRISSTNPTLSLNAGAGEVAVARFVSDWLRDRGFEILQVEATEADRLSVLAVRWGKGGDGARSILFNGHLDTVSLSNYQGDGLSGDLKQGRIYGRGSADMKGGLAAAMVAVSRACSSGEVGGQDLRGDVWIAAVSDEEDSSQGSMDVIRYLLSHPASGGAEIKGAIFPEPTQEAIVSTHRGFVWAKVKVEGKSAHGSMHSLGIDSIAEMGSFLHGFRDLCKGLLSDERSNPVLGNASAHAGTIQGGEEPSTYPGSCQVTLERRTLPGEGRETFQDELEGIVARLDTRCQWEVEMGTTRPPLEVKDLGFLRVVQEVSKLHLGEGVLGGQAVFGGSFWTDAALFSSEMGIPSVVLGPSGFGIHEEVEWVDVESMNRISMVYEDLIRNFSS